MIISLLVALFSLILKTNCSGPQIIGTVVNGISRPAGPLLNRSLNIYLHGTTQLGCKFASNSSVAVSWYKNGAPFTKARTSAPKLDGTHSNHFLFLVKVNLEAAGVYRCIGQSKNVSGGSATFSVTVTGESMPSFLPRYPPYKLMLYKGQSYDLECKVSNYHAVEYAWGMENRNFKSNIFTIRDRTLSFRSVYSKNAGNYTCKASNKIGTAFRTVNVLIVDNPSWKEKPKPVNIVVGMPFQLQASFYGADRGLEISWYKNNILVKKYASWRRIEGYNNGTYITTKLKAYNATVQDSGIYSVKVRNLNHKITADAQVFAMSKPKVVITEGREIVQKVGATVELVCEVEGYPSPNVRWERRDGSVLAKNRVHSQSSLHNFKSTLVLVIPAVEATETYLCVAENHLGRHQEIVKVTAIGLLATTAMPSTLEQMKMEKVDLSVEATVAVVAGAIGFILLLICIVMVYRKRRQDPLNERIHFRRNLESFNDQEIDEECDLIPEGSQYMIPLPPQKFESKRNVEKMSIKRQNLMLDQGKKSGLDATQIYAEILPVGQGRSIRFEDMNLKEVCGMGNFGSVQKGTLDIADSPSKEIAVKMLKDNAGLQERKMMLDELQMLKSLSPHPNVVGLVGWCITRDNVYIVEEYIPNGNLLHYLRSKRKCFNSHYINLREVTQAKCDTEFLLFAWQIAAGMKFLSSQSLIHRDLASRNVLLGHENVCKIADFGLARTIYQNANYKKTGGGQLPVRWMAPESLFSSLYSNASDVWSFGIVLWEIATLGDIPYSNVPTVELLISMLKKKKRMGKPAHCSDNLYSLMLHCWEELPSRRPSFDDIANKLGKMVNDSIIYLDMTKFFEILGRVSTADDEVCSFDTEVDPSESSDCV